MSFYYDPCGHRDGTQTACHLDGCPDGQSGWPSRCSGCQPRRWRTVAKPSRTSVGGRRERYWPVRQSSSRCFFGNATACRDQSTCFICRCCAVAEFAIQCRAVPGGATGRGIGTGHSRRPVAIGGGTSRSAGFGSNGI